MIPSRQQYATLHQVYTVHYKLTIDQPNELHAMKWSIRGAIDGFKEPAVLGHHGVEYLQRCRNPRRVVAPGGK